MKRLMARRRRLAIDMGRRMLRAVEARCRGGQVEVLRAISVEAPPDLETEDPVATGRWIAEALAAARIKCRQASFAVNRESASLKRLVLSTTHAEDLPDMTRLAMMRELGPAAEGAVIDFIPGGVEESGTVVHALAVAAREIDYIRALARSARLRVERISLRTFGTAALLETLDEASDPGATRLGIDLTGEGLELCFVSDGEVRHSRGAEIKYERDASVSAELASTEVRRSWAAWRLAQPEVSISRAILMGEQEIARRVGASAEAVVGPIRILTAHPRISGRTDAVDACWPLAGMLLEEALDRPRIDLASPRRAPDLAARRRMMVYASAGLVVVSLLAGWTIGSRELRALRERAADLRQKAEGAKPESQKFKRDFFRAQHLAAWEESAPRWLDTLVDIGSFAPDQTQVVFDLFNGTIESGGGARVVKEAGKETRIAIRRPMRVTLEGEAKERAAVDALREAFVKDARFSLDSPGTDKVGGRRFPMPFTFILRPGGGSTGAAATGAGGAAGGAGTSPAAPGATSDAGDSRLREGARS